MMLSKLWTSFKTWRVQRGEALCARGKHKWKRKIDILPMALPVWSGYECKRCKEKAIGLAFY